MIEIPEGLEYWTADEIAECLSGVSNATGQRLWDIQSECDETAKPRGGDGSNGTTEIPIVDYSYGDQPRAFWKLLTPEQQKEIAKAYTQRNDEI
jgi:hypothetical protein